jgi:hypothetical protein
MRRRFSSGDECSIADIPPFTIGTPKSFLPGKRDVIDKIRGFGWKIMSLTYIAGRSQILIDTPLFQKEPK